MGDWYSEIIKPSWIVSTLVGIVVFNWVGDLIRRGFGLGLGFLSTSWSNRSKKKRKAWQDRVARLAVDADARADERHEEIKALLQAGIMGVMTVLTLVIQDDAMMEVSSQVWMFRIFFRTAMLFTLVMMVVTVFQSGNHRRALSEAKKLRELVE